MESPLFVPRIYAIRNSTNSSLPYIELTIGKTSVTALIDSGASISYIKLSTVHGSACHIIPSKKYHGNYSQWNDHPTAGMCKITYQNRKVHNQPQTLDLSGQGLPCTVIARIRLHPPTQQKWSTSFARPPQPRHRHQRRTLQPSSGTNITVQTETPLHVLIDGTPSYRDERPLCSKIRGLPPHAAMDVLIEDNRRLTDDLFVVGRALVSPSTDGTCYINIINPSNTNIHIKDKTKIAKATPVAYHEIQVLAVHQQPLDHIIHNPANAVPSEADWEARLPHFPVYPPPKNFDIAAEIDLSASALSEEQKRQLRIILRYHTDAFVGPDGHLGHYEYSHQG
ncbi:unnamed protein product [Heligmosomoides polygyrus]|uniref:Peptidase A1 domain-containing protein n=1 Tax=Heligmosomoides polygyrus TaxID=6339 RepID=A0A183FF75_HELPZ|nr:unnamed protein product [Heligmosomoides polygyrus]